MSRPREKKFEAVFKMQFQVAQVHLFYIDQAIQDFGKQYLTSCQNFKVPPLNAKGLMISLVPVDAEKPTARLDRAKINEGAYTWENPVFENVELVQDIKTGRIREKFFYLIVSTGSSKSGFLGEVSINFADLAEATKAMDLVLPLQTSRSGAILHVTVQRMQEDQNSRSTEDAEFFDAGTRDRHSCWNRSLISTQSEASSDERSRSSAGAESVNNRVKLLGRKAEVAEIVKQTKKRHRLADTIKTECQQLKSDLLQETESMEHVLETFKKELQFEKHLNDKLKLQLQKTEDSNSELVLVLRDLNKNMDQKNTEISELSSKIKALRSEKIEPDEEKLLKRIIENLYSQVEAHKKEKEDILMEVKQLTIDGEKLDNVSRHIYSTLQQTEKEKMKMEQNYSESLATIKQLELRVETLEEENKRQQLQYSKSLTIIEEAEIQVENLRKELENQAQVYEEELNTVTKEKFEEEQQAMRAEDAFRKSRWNNAYGVEQLQEEIKKLSDEMSLKIEENEKLAQKSIAEATDLQSRNKVLESMLQKSEEERRTKITQYERIVHELKEQNERIYIKEHEDFERQLFSVREEMDKLNHENISMKSQIDQKNSKEVNLNLEVKKLRLKNSEMKNHLSQVELEKEDLKKEVATLQDCFQKNKVKNTNEGRAKPRVVDGLSKQTEHDSTAQIISLWDEVGSLKERNRSTEKSLKEMHEIYSELSLRFAEVEGERQHLVFTLQNLRSGKKN